MFRIVLAIFISLFFIGQGFAQENAAINLFEKYRFDNKIWPSFEYAAVTNELQQYGMTTNPGIAKNDQLKTLLCDTCDLNSVKSIYMERWVHDDLSYIDAGVIVYLFEKASDAAAIIPKIERYDYERFLVDGPYLIYIWNNEEEEDVQAQLLKKAVHYYQSKGAIEKQVKIKVVHFTEEEILKARASYEEEEIKPIGSNENKKVKHLFASEDAFIAFYDDGTVSICPSCILNQEQLEALKKEEPYSIYIESNSGLIIQSKDRGQSESTIIDFSENEIGKWMILNHIVLTQISK